MVSEFETFKSRWDLNLQQIPIIDTHEHLRSQQEFIRQGISFASLIPRAYMGFFDFFPGLKIKKGRTLSVPPPLTSHQKTIFFWNLYHNRNFRVAMEYGLKEIYGWDSKKQRLTKQILQDLNTRLIENYSQPGWGGRVFQSHGICHLINDGFDPHIGLDFLNADFFTGINTESLHPHCAFRLNSFIYAFSPDCWNPLTNNAVLCREYYKMQLYQEFPQHFSNNMIIDSADSFLDMIPQILKCVAHDFKSVKFATAYERPLKFSPKDVLRERNLLRQYWNTPLIRISESLQWKLGDILFHECLSALAQLPVRQRPIVQFHTGFATRFDSRPQLLEHIVQEYPDLQFHFMHGGYPNLAATLNLITRYPNVYSELVWLPLLEKKGTIWMFQEIYRRHLEHKVLAFGGDCACVEGTIGTLLATRDYFLESFYRLREKQTKKIPDSDIETFYKAIIYNTPKSAYNL
jgi:predicted TIM-barrel fold metal-dependent hydrolase